MVAFLLAKYLCFTYGFLFNEFSSKTGKNYPPSAGSLLIEYFFFKNLFSYVFKKYYNPIRILGQSCYVLVVKNFQSQEFCKFC